jgi:hypothetical protein
LRQQITEGAEANDQQLSVWLLAAVEKSSLWIPVLTCSVPFFAQISVELRDKPLAAPLTSRARRHTPCMLSVSKHCGSLSRGLPELWTSATVHYITYFFSVFCA